MYSPNLYAMDIMPTDSSEWNKNAEEIQRSIGVTKSLLYYNPLTSMKSHQWKPD